MKDINQILKEITTKGSIYDEIINNLISPRLDLKPELISEVALSFLENKDKIETVYKDGYFKYFFIRVVKNQIHSNTSSFHKNCRIYSNDVPMSLVDIIETSEIEDKIKFEEDLELINETYNDTKKNWFQDRMWNEYFIKGKSYREIGKEYGINHVTIFHHIKPIQNQIKNKLNM